MKLRIILVLHMLLQESILYRLWTFLNRLLGFLVESGGIRSLLLHHRLVKQGRVRLRDVLAGASICLQSEVLRADMRVK